MKVCQVCAVDMTHTILLDALNRAIVAAGHDLVLVASPGPYLDRLAAEGYRVQGIKIRRDLNLPAHAAALQALHRFMRRERFDLVHVHTPVAALLGRLAARWAGVPLIVYTAHGFYFHEHMPRLPRTVYQGLEWIAGRLTSFLFTQSTEDAVTAVRLGFLPADRVLAIGNGVDLARFDPDNCRGARARVRAEWGIAAEERVIVSTGRLVREKGFAELFHAVHAINQSPATACHLLVVGAQLPSDPRDGLLAEVKRLMASPALSGRVHLLGHREDLEAVLHAGDLFVLASHREGMPRSIIEAMACGLPVVATQIRGCREEVVDGVTGRLVPLGAQDDLTEAIAQLVVDPATAARMGRAGLARARELYDERAIVARQLAVYDRLARERRR